MKPRNERRERNERLDEIQAVLDMLFVSKNLRFEMEDAMWRQARTYPGTPSKLAQFFGKMPEPMPVGWTKAEFDDRFRELVRAALGQCDKIREGKTPDEIYPVNARPLALGAGKYCVEIFMGSGRSERIEGFTNYHEADAWIRNKGRDFVVSKGLPDDTDVYRVGQDYW